jgi:hypothetical protein
MSGRIQEARDDHGCSSEPIKLYRYVGEEHDVSAGHVAGQPIKPPQADRQAV